MNAVNNFRQEGPLYTREFFQDIVANLEAEERNVIDTGELDEGAYGSERGDYSVDVLEQALVFAQYQTSRRFLDFNVDSSFGFIYNPGNHWIAVRRVQNQWVEFDSMATGPVVITQSEVIDLLNDYGNSMIIVTGESTA
ncbi:ataxin-3 homolog isoform X2 [Folsomia candida]|nr:ataxin-3 homolog isoform X2 [Folsomia candida]